MLDQLAASIHNRLNQSGKADVVCICTHRPEKPPGPGLGTGCRLSLRHQKHQRLFRRVGGHRSVPHGRIALEKAGLTVLKLSTGINPVYAIDLHPDEPALIGFSKTYDDPFNVKTASLPL
ncbi:MAG: hypothetical protein R2806_11095 [Saprospiraceae bacterium]